MNALRVLADGQWLGTVEAAQDHWSFEYTPEWTAYPLSPNFPLSTRQYQDTAERRQVEWFFENLLPEGRLRELIACRDRIDSRDTWALLIRHGQDTAGALSLVPYEFLRTSVQKKLVPLAREALQAKIQESRKRNVPLMASWDEIRMSLAGAQEKLALYIDFAGNLFLPEGTAASTHIVKPENTSTDFPFCTANEFFCMRLAAELKVPVPAVDLLHLPEPLYIIKRFDRDRASGKLASEDTVQRLHQIDLCQALGVSPTRKYESEGGLGLNHLFDVLQGAFIDRPAVAINAVVQWVAFNYLIGNLDAHAKNIAFLIRGRTTEVAPFYDLLCVEAYLPRTTMAMGIAGENKPGWVEGIHWDALAFEAGVAPRLVRSVLKKMVTQIHEGVSRVIRDERLTADECDFVRSRIVPVIDERCAFVGEALKSRRAILQDVLASREIDPVIVGRLKAAYDGGAR